MSDEWCGDIQSNSEMLLVASNAALVQTMEVESFTEDTNTNNDTTPASSKNRCPGTYFCTICDIQMNSSTQLATHIKGRAHQKRLVKATQAETFTKDIDIDGDDMFSIVSSKGVPYQQDPQMYGSEDDVTLPVASSSDKEQQQVTQKKPFNNAVPDVELPPIEERLQSARNHSPTCNFQYDESFKSFPLVLKVKSLSSQVAFIGKDEPVPDFWPLPL